jgi:hypothetical protein
VIPFGIAPFLFVLKIAFSNAKLPLAIFQKKWYDRINNHLAVKTREVIEKRKGE